MFSKTRLTNRRRNAVSRVMLLSISLVTAHSSPRSRVNAKSNYPKIIFYQWSQFLHFIVSRTDELLLCSWRMRWIGSGRGSTGLILALRYILKLNAIAFIMIPHVQTIIVYSPCRKPSIVWIYSDTWHWQNISWEAINKNFLTLSHSLNVLVFKKPSIMWSSSHLFPKYHLQ